MQTKFGFPPASAEAILLHYKPTSPKDSPWISIRDSDDVENLLTRLASTKGSGYLLLAHPPGTTAAASAATEPALKLTGASDSAPWHGRIHAPPPQGQRSMAVNARVARKLVNIAHQRDQNGLKGEAFGYRRAAAAISDLQIPITSGAALLAGGAPGIGRKMAKQIDAILADQPFLAHDSPSLPGGAPEPSRSPDIGKVPAADQAAPPVPTKPRFPEPAAFQDQPSTRAPPSPRYSYCRAGPWLASSGSIACPTNAPCRKLLLHSTAEAQAHPMHAAAKITPCRYGESCTDNDGRDSCLFGHRPSQRPISGKANDVTPAVPSATPPPLPTATRAAGAAEEASPPAHPTEPGAGGAETCP